MKNVSTNVHTVELCICAYHLICINLTLSIFGDMGFTCILGMRNNMQIR